MARMILFVLLALVSVSFACPRKCTLKCEWRRRRRDTGEIGTPTDTNMRADFFHLIDLNNDGLVDGAEWTEEGGKQNGCSAILENHDANGDGMISLEEFQTVHLDPSEELFIEDVLGAEDEVENGMTK